MDERTNSSAGPTGILARLSHLPANAVVSVCTMDNAHYDHCCIAIVSGALELITPRAIYQGHAQSVYLIPREALLRAVDADAKFWQLCYSEPYLQQALTESSTVLPDDTAGVYRIMGSTATFKIIRRLMQLLQTYSTGPATPKSALLCKFAFNLLLNSLSDHPPVFPVAVKAGHKRREQTAIKFLHLIAENVTRHHDVRFYAGQLFMTQGNLARIIKEATGKTPKLLIEQALTAAAKVELDTSTESIYGIAEKLNFNSSPAFISFFRTHTGLTPNEYRNRDKT